MDDSIPVGTLIGQRWRVLGPLGAGGFGQVLEAEDGSEVGLGRAAVKVLHPNTSARERQDFLGEVKQMAALRHQNLVGYLDSGLLNTDDGEIRPFLVTELCDRSLKDHLEAFGGKLPRDQVVKVLTDIAAGLAHLHGRGLIHRDIKPGNALFADGHWKLADFGLMRNLTATGSYHRGDLLMGTPLFMAPELFTTMTATTASDVYAFGVMAHLVASGRPVHQGAGPALIHNLTSSPPTIDRTLDPGLGRLVAHCLDREPSRRPSADHLVTLVADWSAGRQPSPGGQLGAPPDPRWPAPTVAAGLGPSTGTTTAAPGPPPQPAPTGPEPAHGAPTPRPFTQPGSLPAAGGSSRRLGLLAGVGSIVVLAVVGLFLLTRGGDDTGSDESATQTEAGEDDADPQALTDDGDDVTDDDAGDGEDPSSGDDGVEIGDGVDIGDGVEIGGGDTAGSAFAADGMTHFASEPCQDGPGGVIELTNRDDRTLTYEMLLDHYDADGVRLSQTFESVRSLGPGETALFDLTSPEEEAASCEVNRFSSAVVAPGNVEARGSVEIERCELDDFLSNWYAIEYVVTNSGDEVMSANTSFAVVDADGVRLDESFGDLLSDIGPGERVRGETSQTFWSLDRIDREAVDCVVASVTLS